MTPRNHHRLSNMGRRRFLKIMAGAVAGAGVVAFGIEQAQNANAAGHGTQSLDSFRYKGKSLDMMGNTSYEMLHINGQAMPDHVFNKTAAGYTSHMLPFENFSSRRELAKKLVDGDGTLYILTPGDHPM